MLLHYFYKKENKEKNYIKKLYLKNIRLSINFIKSDKFILKNDFKTSFEVFSLFLIFHLKIFKDLKISNFEKVNQDLINLFINDLDYSFREIGISDMKIGKYVKSHIKKFYYRLSTMEKILNTRDLNKTVNFLSKLNFIEIEQTTIFSKEILNVYSKIQSSLENNYKFDNN